MNQAKILNFNAVWRSKIYCNFKHNKSEVNKQIIFNTKKDFITKNYD